MRVISLLVVAAFLTCCSFNLNRTLDGGGTADSAASDSAIFDGAAHDTAQADTDTPDSAQPDTVQPDTALPDAPLPDMAQPDTVQADTAQPDTAQPDTAQPDTAQPDTAQPDAALPDAPLPDAPLPDAALPDAPLPDAPLPDAPLPDTALPDTIKPDTLPGPSCGTPTSGMDTITISGGSLNGTALSATQLEVTVAAGGALSGTIQAQIVRNGCPGCVTAAGATPSWGPPKTSYVCAGSWMGTGTFTKTVTINTTVPTTPGTYHIIWARGLEYTCDQVMSATHWDMSSAVWGDGNDIASWSAAQIKQAMTSGYACALWLGSGGYGSTWIPSAAVKVHVTPCTQAPTPDWVQISGGSLNGTALSSTAKTVSVGPGKALAGTITAQIYRDSCASCVTVFGVTPNWGTPKGSNVCPSSFMGTGTITKTVTINTTAPATPGTYHIIAARGLEYTCDQVFSATSWKVGAGTWGDGNDIAGWAPWQIAYAVDHRYTCATWLGSAGFGTLWLPADAVTVVVK